MENNIYKCHLCDNEAIGLFYFSEGCYCDMTKDQPLCLHHAFKSGPNNGGAMILIEDLTLDKSFTSYWKMLGSFINDH